MSLRHFTGYFSSVVYYLLFMVLQPIFVLPENQFEFSKRLAVHSFTFLTSTDSVIQ